ncbi:E3 ubiquitin-protein ligase TRIM58 isoform X2 [Callorhinchus milii]|uniref:E3 ubiquitin-protein ligase TRIM58 isoform X2 n=1 Tax=Callorhinchus milii TaxID=7868 RepID=UPI001C3F990F|nr:E3 ubiquitin-protein ligase TRIM58 isoform X2 [Callorhinchus milii]
MSDHVYNSTEEQLEERNSAQQLDGLNAELARLKQLLKDKAEEESGAEDPSAGLAVVKLDSSSADPLYSVLSGNSSLTWQSTPGQKKAGHTWAIWAIDAISSGKHYWEVTLEGSAVWFVGLGRKTLKLSWLSRPKPQDGQWAMMMWNMSRDSYQIRSLGSDIVLVQLNRIGIYVDYEGGKVAFYNPDNHNLLMVLNGPFNGQIYPLFRLCVSGQQNIKLTIS